MEKKISYWKYVWMYNRLYAICSALVFLVPFIQGYLILGLNYALLFAFFPLLCGVTTFIEWRKYLRLNK